jgi:hypothetical protein
VSSVRVVDLVPDPGAVATVAAALIGIEPYEVRQALEAKRRWPRRATSVAVPVLTILGPDPGGPTLIVAVYHVSGFTWKIIGARRFSK